MVDPLIALLIGIGVIVVSVLIFWPESGLFWRLQKRRELTDKVLIEDTLKYIFKCDRNQKPATLESLAGVLSTSQGRASEILAITQAKGLLEMSGKRFSLTPAGRNAAIQIVRAHRLWERYLADATGFEETDWHQQAERLEHKLSVEDTERLSASLGHPTHDPHGDPIPTSRGDSCDCAFFTHLQSIQGDSLDILIVVFFNQRDYRDICRYNWGKNMFPVLAPEADPVRGGFIYLYNHVGMEIFRDNLDIN